MFFWVLPIDFAPLGVAVTYVELFSIDPEQKTAANGGTHIRLDTQLWLRVSAAPSVVERKLLMATVATGKSTEDKNCYRLSYRQSCIAKSVPPYATEVQ